MLSKYFNNPKDREDFTIAIVVIALAGMLIGYFTFYQDKSIFDGIGTLVTQNTMIDTLEVDGMTYVAVATDDEMTEDAQTHKSKIVPVTPIETMGIDTLAGKNDATEVTTDEASDGDSAIDSDEVGATESTKDLLDSILSDENDPIDDEPIIMDEMEKQPDGSDELPTVEEPAKVDIIEPVKEKSKEVPTATPNSKCIVVLGAYGNQTNIRKLIGRLDQEGYPVFKVPYRGLTRVGAYIDCKYSTSLLEKLKREYSSDAFLMKAK